MTATSAAGLRVGDRVDVIARDGWGGGNPGEVVNTESLPGYVGVRLFGESGWHEWPADMVYRRPTGRVREGS